MTRCLLDRPARRDRKVRQEIPADQPGLKAPKARPDQLARKVRKAPLGTMAQPGRKGHKVRPGQSARKAPKVHKVIQAALKDRPARQAPMAATALPVLKARPAK